MRIKIIFHPNGKFLISVSYNAALQAFIYKHLSASLAAKIHNEGYRLHKRSYKLFTFSRFYSTGDALRYDSNKNTLETDAPFYFILSSPISELIEEFASSMAREDSFFLGRSTMQVSEIDVIKQPEFRSEAIIKMLSPVTVYSTLLKPDGVKKTYYYHPREPEFNELVRANLIKKFLVLCPDKKNMAEELSHSPFKIEPVSGKFAPRQEIITYKGFVIKSYMGIYRVEADPILLEIAYDAGIGAKNSMGFGLFEIYKPKLNPNEIREGK